MRMTADMPRGRPRISAVNTYVWSGQLASGPAVSHATTGTPVLDKTSRCLVVALEQDQGAAPKSLIERFLEIRPPNVSGQ
jgi:hypothetical protein